MRSGRSPGRPKRLVGTPIKPKPKPIPTGPPLPMFQRYHIIAQYPGAASKEECARDDFLSVAERIASEGGVIVSAHLREQKAPTPPPAPKPKKPRKKGKP